MGVSRTSWVVLAAALLGGCHASAPRQWESSLIVNNAEALAGARAAPTIEARFGGVVRDADAEHRIEFVGRRLTRGLPDPGYTYRYRLLDSDKINALSLPGGRVYITRGLYARLSSDDLLAAVLAHEVAHLASRDHFKPAPSDAGQALKRELSADAYALRILGDADLRRTALIDLVLLIEDALPAGWAEARAANLTERLRDGDNIAPNIGMK